jgi:hypothetical protein
VHTDVTATDASGPPDSGADAEREEARLTELALALVGDDQFWPAAQTFARLVVLTGATPASDIHRQSLASTFEDLGWYRSSAHQLRQVVDHSPVEEHRARALSQLERLREVVAENDADVRLRTLQFECALEWARRRTENVFELERLGKLTVSAVDSPQGVDVAGRALSILGPAHEEHPGSVDIGRGVLACHLSLGNRDGAEQVLQRLEALEPEDVDLKRIAADLAAGVASPAVGGAPHTVPHLVEMVAHGLSGDDDPGLQSAALSDLKDISERWPHDSDAVFAYAFGLVAADRADALVALLPRLLACERPEQTFHYNLAQLYVFGGDRQQGKDHLVLASRYAVTDTEREEVDDLAGRLGLETADG